MDIELTQEQSVMKETARLFAHKSLSPSVSQFDEMDAPYPAGWMDRASELGFMNMFAPPDYGGAGARTLDAGLVIEELAGGCAGMAASVVAGLAGVLAVLNSGAPKEMLDRLLGEPFRENPQGFRATAAGLFTTPFRVAQDGTVSGEEASVPGAEHTSFCAVLAREGEGTSCWIIPPDLEGVEFTPMHGTLGIRPARPGRLTLKRVEGIKLGAVDSDALLAIASTMLGCAAVGCARAALDDAENYARERYQGGDQIIRHDTVAHLILNNRARIDAARSRLWEIMAQNDAIIDPETGALKGKPDIRAALLARVFAIDAAQQATIDAVQCFGGYGYMHDYPVEKRMRDARSLGALFGTNPDLLTYIKPSLAEG